MYTVDFDIDEDHPGYMPSRPNSEKLRATSLCSVLEAIDTATMAKHTFATPAFGSRNHFSTRVTFLSSVVVPTRISAGKISHMRLTGRDGSR
jgi:hypothetical protein